ncbi:MAG: acyl-CoA/acyl-ACP dehydrogenase [Myxococcaceae bacterium]|nr:acyl-CoA/acyl-ACP dehydrogenase [Myxococcaceae bacterium]
MSLVSPEVLEQIRARAAEVDAQAKFPKENIAALGKAGLLGLCVPKERGGRGEGPAAFAQVVESIASACASTAMVYVMHVTAAQAIEKSRSPERDALLGAIARGAHLTTLAFSEKGSRSQFWAPVSKLEPGPGNTLRTTALKSFVTSASHADSYVSSAQQPGAASPMESTLYLVRKGHDGVRIQGGFDGLGLRGNDSAPVVLEAYEIDDKALLTEHGKGAAMMLDVVLPWFAIGTSAMAVGLCREAVRVTSQHLSGTGFEHTGSQLRDLPTLRARLSEMSVRTEQAAALLDATLTKLQANDPATPLFVLQTRIAALEAAVEVTDLAMKACGGAAFSKQLGVERLFRDARAGWVMAPTVDHLKDFVGRALTGMPLFG